MRRSLLLIFGIIWMVQAHSEQETKAVSGPLCADVLLSSSARPEGDDEGIRNLRVFEAGRPSFESDEAVLCKTCGSALGDPFQGMEWKGQTLTVSNYGGL